MNHTLSAKSRVISASRRTDIPRFYAEWLMTRIRKGVVAVPNPNNADSVSWQSLKPETVDAIVFWTKDPRPLLPHLPELDDLGFRYYFQYTLTGYPEWLEPNTPHGSEAIDAFRETSERVGAHRVVWRYDPISFLPGLTEEWHLENHARLAADLEGLTNRCVISFLDVFRKTAGNLRRACLAHGLDSFEETGASFPSDPRAFGDTFGATGRRSRDGCRDVRGAGQHCLSARVVSDARAMHRRKAAGCDWGGGAQQDGFGAAGGVRLRGKSGDRDVRQLPTRVRLLLRHDLD